MGIDDRSALDHLLATHNVAAVSHCAGLKVMSESAQQPLRHFQNNVSATVSFHGRC
ncbi:hypothetical protein CAter282_2521 [Collimonas arenae]|uniref:NAD-dependent epimerase/dehydratase domain-containing protein n=2 Tax=Collimonas arenae TaxID=279058 RepID=A0A127PSM7_9BURK|nr:hypothetical protein CAter10_2776 [Collimonas arenae]AMP10260.1 hypothetical protein CAter282_2521 [Collimonas arenae]